MSAKSLLDAEKTHLAQLLKAIQRCVYFLHAAAFNERFAKLQDFKIP